MSYWKVQIMKTLTVVPLLLLTAVLASGGPLGPFGLSNTGASGTTVSGVTTDNNWTINGSTTHAFITNSGFPIGSPWIANSSTSMWISPAFDYNAGNSDPVAQFTYETHFDLSGLANPTTASFLFRFAVDNDLIDVRVNGTSIGPVLPGFFAYFTGPVTISSSNAAFISGINTLDFVTQNTPAIIQNPAGLRVEFDSATPEPGTYGLVGIALATFGLVHRRRARR